MLTTCAQIRHLVMAITPELIHTIQKRQEAITLAAGWTISNDVWRGPRSLQFGDSLGSGTRRLAGR